jgi:hypothetical protein
LIIIPTVPVVAPELFKSHLHRLANITKYDKGNTKLNNLEDFEIGQKVHPDTLLRTKTETKPTTETNLLSPRPILDRQNHTDPELHIIPPIMTNPDIQNENHLSRFVSPLPEHKLIIPSQVL